MNKNQLVRQIEAYGLRGKLADLAQRLADKAIFVRKKLDAGFQYQINRRIRIMYEHKHHIKPNSSPSSLEKR